MKRLSVIVAFTTVLLAFAPAASAASPHFMKSVPQCHVSGLTVTCDRSVIAGVGNLDAQADLVVNVSAHVDCRNHGGQIVEAHEASVSSSSSTGQLEPKNGKLTVPQLSASGSSSPSSFPCPNPNWTAEVSNVQLSWTYTIWFLTNPPTLFFSLSS
jgi:hypothetical protein